MPGPGAGLLRVFVFSLPRMWLGGEGLGWDPRQHRAWLQARRELQPLPPHSRPRRRARSARTSKFGHPFPPRSAGGTAAGRPPARSGPPSPLLPPGPRQRPGRGHLRPAPRGAAAPAPEGLKVRRRTDLWERGKELSFRISVALGWAVQGGAME